MKTTYIVLSFYHAPNSKMVQNMRKVQPKGICNFFLTMQSKEFSPTSRNFHSNFIKDAPKVSQSFMNNYNDHLPQKNGGLHNKS